MRDPGVSRRTGEHPLNCRGNQGVRTVAKILRPSISPEACFTRFHTKRRGLGDRFFSSDVHSTPSSTPPTRTGGFRVDRESGVVPPGCPVRNCRSSKSTTIARSLDASRGSIRQSAIVRTDPFHLDATVPNSLRPSRPTHSISSIRLPTPSDYVLRSTRTTRLIRTLPHPSLTPGRGFDSETFRSRCRYDLPTPSRPADPID